MIAEIDGSMIPIVATVENEKSKDKRRNRFLSWQEARLCFARGAESVTPIFAATMGSVDRVGELLYQSALRVGFGRATSVHCLGDGAPWIADQVQRIFGNQAKFLVDFYHTSEYLSAAAEHSWSSQKEEWFRAKQEMLKKNQYNEVLADLARRLPQGVFFKKI